MNNRISTLFCCILIALGFGCNDKDIPTTSRITYFPDFIFEGENRYDIGCGESFTLPPTRVEEEGTEIDFNTSISGLYFNQTDGGTLVNSEIPDLYSVEYSAVNKDGFEGTAERIVNVKPCNGDLVTSIEGSYHSTVLRGGKADPQYENLGPIYLADLGDNVYGISHAVGGYYDYGRGFGSGYSAYGAKVKANDISSNDFSQVDIGVFPIWGNTVEISDFKVDAAAKTVTFTGTGNFGNGVFEVILTQVD